MQPSPKLLSKPSDASEAVELILSAHQASANFAIAVDIEGHNIGPKEGRIAIVTVALPDKTVYLFDVATAGDAIFREGLLKDLLEHQDVVKLMFDCRADTASLFHHNVRPANVVDLQVGANCHFASMARSRSYEFLTGLSKSLEKLRLPINQAVKEQGLQLFAPERGGSYEVFFERPMTAAILNYCAEDVKHLFTMRQGLLRYEEKSKKVAAERIEKFSNDRFPSDRNVLRETMTRVDFSLA